MKIPFQKLEGEIIMLIYINNNKIIIQIEIKMIKKLAC